MYSFAHASLIKPVTEHKQLSIYNHYITYGKTKPVFSKSQRSWERSWCQSAPRFVTLLNFICNSDDTVTLFWKFKRHCGWLCCSPVVFRWKGSAVAALRVFTAAPDSRVTHSISEFRNLSVFRLCGGHTLESFSLNTTMMPFLKLLGGVWRGDFKDACYNDSWPQRSVSLCFIMSIFSFCASPT